MVPPASESMMTLQGARFGGMYRTIENVVPGIIERKFHAIMPARHCGHLRSGGTIVSVYRQGLSEADNVT